MRNSVVLPQPEGAEQGDKFPALHSQIDRTQNLRRAERFRELNDVELRHAVT